MVDSYTACVPRTVNGTGHWRLAPLPGNTPGVPLEYSKHLGVPSYTWVYPRGGTRH